jgi:3-hydroxyisobutyrate dehydrogenase
MTLRVGFVGPGAMGLPMARNLHRAGLLAASWNRTREGRGAGRRDRRAGGAGSPTSLAADCDLVVTCVSADADLLEVVDALRRPCARRVVVDCSTVAASTARDRGPAGSPTRRGVPRLPGQRRHRGAAPARCRSWSAATRPRWSAPGPALEAMGGSIT